MNKENLELALTTVNARIDSYIVSYADPRSAVRVDSSATTVGNLLYIKHHIEKELSPEDKDCKCNCSCVKKVPVKKTVTK